LDEREELVGWCEHVVLEVMRWDGGGSEETRGKREREEVYLGGRDTSEAEFCMTRWVEVLRPDKDI